MTTPTDREAEANESVLLKDLPVLRQAQVLQAREKVADKRSHGAPPLLQHNHSQVELRPSDLESLSAEDHRARLVWGYVGRLIQKHNAYRWICGGVSVDYPPSTTSIPAATR